MADQDTDQAAIEKLRQQQDGWGHVWLPGKKHFDWWVEVCWRCRCMKVQHPTTGLVLGYKWRKLQLRLEAFPPKCKKHSKSECPI